MAVPLMSVVGGPVFLSGDLSSVLQQAQTPGVAWSSGATADCDERWPAMRPECRHVTYLAGPERVGSEYGAYFIDRYVVNVWGTDDKKRA
jgi:hypothetical protein